MCKKTNGQAWKPNDRQERFIAAYTGNASAAAKIAGYAHPGPEGHRLMKNPHIRKRIEDREETGNNKIIATRQDLQAFWTTKMEYAKKDSDQLKASELLGRSQGCFLDKVEHSGNITNLPTDVGNLNPRQKARLAKLLRIARG